MQFFSISLTLCFLIQIFPVPRVTKPPKGFDYELLTNFICDEIVFHLFTVTKFSCFLIKLAFFKFFYRKFLSFFMFSQSREPRNLLWGLLLGYCVLSRLNGMSFKILTSRIFAFFGQNLIFLTFSVIIQVFWASMVRKPALGFDNKLPENFCFFGTDGLVFNCLISKF